MGATTLRSMGISEKWDPGQIHGMIIELYWASLMENNFNSSSEVIKNPNKIIIGAIIKGKINSGKPNENCTLQWVTKKWKQYIFYSMFLWSTVNFYYYVLTSLLLAESSI